ncbi:hypothetical protein ACFL6P_04915 [Candidatus Latescibacterota bacterium]
MKRIQCLIAIIAAIALFPVFSSADAPNYTSMVYPGADGALEYAPDYLGNTIPDYSHAGYMGGGVPLPHIPVRETVFPVNGDAAQVIQDAIDNVSALPPDGNGFRGAVLIKRGYYELHSPLTISAGGVVLRGEGSGDTGTILFAKTTHEMKEKKRSYLNVTFLITIDGGVGIETLPETAADISGEYVPAGARSFKVVSAKGFRVGDTVIVRGKINREYLFALGIKNKEKFANGDTWAYEYDRVITGISGNEIEVDAPITCPIEAKWGGGEIVKYTDRRISQIGVENLRGVSEYDQTVLSNEYGQMNRPNYIGEEYYADEGHYGTLIRMDNVRNGWVRDVSMRHFGKSLVILESGAKWITVQDCESREPVSRANGGRRFIYNITGQLCLVQRCTSDKGRHSFVLGGALTTGPNVFLDCTATRIYGSSEPHATLIVGALYDNVKASIAFRYAESNPPRWLGIWDVLWNCEGLFLCQRPPTAQNYAFGQIGLQVNVFNAAFIDYSFENGHIESWDEHVTPRSLYLKQLEDRLGREAVGNIGY